MKTLLLEGMATSGKSTIIKQLGDELGTNMSIKIVPETETLMKIVENTDRSVSIAYLSELIKNVYSHDYDVIIFDRLYLTHIFRTHSSMADYKVIEDGIRQYTPETIFLEVDESAIAERVARASEHRDPEWKDYIYTKGETIEEIADYYIQQQHNQLTLLEQSTLPHTIFNTTNHDYAQIGARLIDVVRN